MDKTAFLTNLLSGLIGAVIGAIIGARATLVATKQMLEATQKQEMERRDFERERSGRQALDAFRAEVAQNIETANKWQTSHSKAKLSTTAWSAYMSQVSYLDPEVQKELVDTYSLISRYNGLVDYDLAKIPHGGGYIDEDIKRKAAELKMNLEKLLITLEGSYRAREDFTGL